MALAPLSAGFQSLLLLPTSKVGPSGADSRVGCVHSTPLWVSPTNSPVRLGVSPAAASTPGGVFNQWFEALFPCAGTLGCAVCHPLHQLLPQRPAAALPTRLHNPPPCWVLQLLPGREFSLPGCLSPPLLQVWMNVSSLSPWLLDFHTVRFSVSSGCFLFLNFLSFFWLWEEAQCVYLHLHLGRKP